MTAVDDAYQSQRAQTVATVRAAAAEAWAEGFRDRERVIQEVLHLVHAGQALTASLVDAYMASVVGTRPQGLDPDRYQVSALRGVPAEEVYERPFGALGGQLEKGATFTAAFKSSTASLDRLILTDMQLAQTHSARDWMLAEDRVLGYRRVADANACTLCLMASTQRYHKADLMPIHHHCSCSVQVIAEGTRVSDAGVVDADLLRDLKASGRAGDLSLQTAARRARIRAAENRGRAAEWLREASSEADPRRQVRLAERARRYDRRADAQEDLAQRRAADLGRRRAEREGVTLAVRQDSEIGPMLVNSSL